MTYVEESLVPTLNVLGLANEILSPLTRKRAQDVLGPRLYQDFVEEVRKLVEAKLSDSWRRSPQGLADTNLALQNYLNVIEGQHFSRPTKWDLIVGLVEYHISMLAARP